MIRVGKYLYEERMRKGLTIEEVAKETHIRPQFITAIENGNYRKLPSSAYAIGFVKNYISFLGLSTKQLLPLFRREFDAREHFGVLPESFTKEKNIPVRRVHIGRILIITFLVLIPLCTYILFQYRAAIFSPALTIQTPTENAHITVDTVTISGRTDANVLVSVDNASVLVDQNGNFRKDITVFPGLETITIKAVNSFGKTTVVQRHIMVQ